MGSPVPAKDAARLAARVQSLVARGLDVVDAYATARSSLTPPARALAKHERGRARALAEHDKAIRRHESHLRSLRGRAVTLTAVSGAGAVLGIVDAASGGGALPGDPWVWLVGAAAAAVFAVRAKWSADHAVAPTPPEPWGAGAPGAAPDVRALRREAIGWQEAQGLIAVRHQIVAMLPAVGALHPDAGRDLAAADGGAGPVLAALVARLVLLDQVVRDLPGTAAAEAATTAAVVVRTRLADGVARYDGVLAAAAAMLAAPDLGRSTDDVLGPAADALTAYAHGLAAGSDLGPL
jgi:hypothetical protein